MNFSSHNHKGNENYENRKDIETRKNAQALSIKSPFKENLHLYVNFSTTYSSSPNIKVTFSGYDHRSWINIFIVYKEIFKDSSSFDFKYLHKTIHLSNGLEANSIMNLKPNGSDQLLVFVPDHSKNHVWKTLDMTIRGNSYKVFILESLLMEDVILKLDLQWNAQLKIVPGSQYLMSLQVESYQLKADFVQKCYTKEKCPVLKVYWFTDQLIKYRDNVLNKPSSCLQQPQLDRFYGISCLNFSSYSTKEHYYVYIAQLFSIVGFGKTLRMSWNYASSICQDMGGFLPVIRSKSELNELIAFVALSPYLLIQDKMFIGLSTKIKFKV